MPAINVIVLYNYQHMKTREILKESFSNLLESNWEQDPRSKVELKLLKKIFRLKDGSMYRVILRFSSSDYKTYEIDQPIPFVIMKTEHTSNGIGFKDVETFHGRKAKNILGYMELGIPSEVFELLNKDLLENLKYK